MGPLTLWHGASSGCEWRRSSLVAENVSTN